MQNRKIIEIDMRSAAPESQHSGIRRMLKATGCIEWLDEGPGKRSGALSFRIEELKALTRKKEMITLIIQMTRPGAMTFITQLEWSYFPPDGKSNRNFRVFYVEWIEEMWVVILMPRRTRTKLNRLAKQTRMRIVEGIPRAIEVKSGKVETSSFPIGDYHSIVTLENDEGSPVYGMKPESYPISMQIEKEMTDDFSKRMIEQLRSRYRKNGEPDDRR